MKTPLPLSQQLNLVLPHLIQAELRVVCLHLVHVEYHVGSHGFFAIATLQEAPARLKQHVHVRSIRPIELARMVVEVDDLLRAAVTFIDATRIVLNFAKPAKVTCALVIVLAAVHEVECFST